MNYPNPNNPAIQMQSNNIGNNMPHTHFLSQVALTACGFQQANRSSTPRQIWGIHPHGGTAFRDALLHGNNMMLRLHTLLEQDNTANNWSFLHILITDGHDTDSNASVQQTYQALSTLRGDLNVRDLKIIILGVDIQYGYARSLENLVMAAGIHGQYHDITHTDITRIFARIRENCGMGGRDYYNPNLQAMNQAQMPAQQYYAVLFTLDISGSMYGHKWDVTRRAVVDFIRYLSPNDIVSAVVFNDYPHLVMHWNTRQNQMRLGQMTNNQPEMQIMAYDAYYDPAEFGMGGGNQMRQPLNRNVQYVVKQPQDQCCCAIM